ncbi:MAG: hydroxymethylbilane synthase [Acidimicrobiales bacterium]
MLIRAATRGSPLARWQAEHVAGLLRGVDPAVEVELVVVDTQADRQLDVPIHELGGKGVFAKEVQAAVLEGRADLAVHSAKDLPAITLPGLALAAVPERGDPRDALVGSTLTDLPDGAEVATGSLRRRAELWRHRPDLRMVELRGNMQTRLAKAAQHDVVVVAATALDRLGLADRIAERLAVDVMVPQVAQAALGVECRDDDADLRALLAQVEDAAARRCVDAERAFLAELGGDCSLPAGAHAVLDAGDVTVTAFLGTEDARTTVRGTAVGRDPAVGASLAADLRARLGA